MNPVNLLLLLLSIVLGSSRNLLSKSISSHPFHSKDFYTLQSVIFFAGATVLFPKLLGDGVSKLTLLYALICGLLLLLAQWCYTVAMANGDASVCSIVYSLGFILPTLSGMLFWHENVTVAKIIGILFAIPAIILSKKTSGGDKAEAKGYMLPLTIAMLSSGGLGIMQKVQGTSPYPEQSGAFVFFAFLFAGTVSLICALFKKDGIHAGKRGFGSAAGVGICFAICNLLNTFLAARLDSAVFFPMLNIGVILCSLLLCILFLGKNSHGGLRLCSFSQLARSCLSICENRFSCVSHTRPIL